MSRDFDANEERSWFSISKELEAATITPPAPTKDKPAKPAGPVVSTGGSSSYYCIPLPKWLLEVIAREGAVEVEDLIEVVFGRNFDYGNIFKSLVRAYGLEQGGGKAGNTVEYEMNKVIYSANRIKEIHARKGEI